MARLSSMDALWMSVEKDGGPPIAIGALAVMEGPAPTLEEYTANVRSRLTGRMRERLVPGLLRVRQPKWEDAEPDLGKQIRELELPAPGGEAELHDAVGQIMTVPLDPELPLWDSTLITGLADGTWAVVTRLHHTVADGQGSLMVTGNLIDVDPEGTTTLTTALDAMTHQYLARQAAGEPEDSSQGGTVAKLATATQKGGDLLLRALRTVTSVSATTEVVGAAAGGISKTVEVVGSHMPWIPGPLAGDPGMQRSWEMTQVSLDDVRTIRGSLGGTVNDVVMALMSGGYIRALEKLGKQPDDVRVMVPLSLRTPGDATANNQVSFLLVVLPLAGSAATRLADIHEHINSIKDLRVGAPGIPTQAIVDRTVPAFVQTFAVSNPLALKAGGAFTETLVTNVPGPTFPIYVTGRKVKVLTPIIPLGEPLRLSTGVMSYNGVLYFGISGGEGITDAVPEVAQGIRDTLTELLTASRPD